jgi:hypothetical protein
MSESGFLDYYFAENVRFRVFFMFFAMCLVFSMFAYKISIHSPADPVEELEIINAARQKEFGAFTVQIESGLFIKNFPQFDLFQNRFVADCLVWFEFDTDQIMLDTVGMFSFDNGDIIQKSTPDIRIKGDRTIAEYDVRVSFKSSLHYPNFPLGDHRISLILTNNFMTPREMYFVVDAAAFKVDQSSFIPDWLIVDHSVKAGYKETLLDSRDPSKSSPSPKAVFIVNLKKKGIKKALIIFIPLFLAVFLSLCSFFVRINVFPSRFMMSSSAIPTLLGYRFVLENMLPPVSYFTITDRVFILLLSIAFMIFIFQALVLRFVSFVLDKTKEESELLSYKRIDTLFYFFVISLLVAGTGCCIFL